MSRSIAATSTTSTTTEAPAAESSAPFTRSGAGAGLSLRPVGRGARAAAVMCAVTWWSREVSELQPEPIIALVECGGRHG